MTQVEKFMCVLMDPGGGPYGFCVLTEREIELVKGQGFTLNSRVSLGLKPADDLSTVRDILKSDV